MRLMNIKEDGEMKYKVGDKVRMKKNLIAFRDYMAGIVATISEISKDEFGEYYRLSEDRCNLPWDDEMIEGLVEEETSKFKIDDIVFVKNIGWVRITNSYWDSLANEYIYEAIGLNGEGEYDSINQSNIECQMLPESEKPHTRGNKITLDEYKNNDKEWLFNKLAMLDNITALESIQDIFNHLQQSKYPKSYEECCKVLNLGEDGRLYTKGYKSSLIQDLQKLLICRDAYWRIAGVQMGLGKPWKPDWKAGDQKKYCIYNDCDNIAKGGWHFANTILAFPTEEMRDAFYENFKTEIEICKELL